MTTVKELIEHLTLNYKPDDHIAAVIWNIDDVMTQANNNDIPITKRQAVKIIDAIDRQHDASIGITWDTIDAHLTDYRKT